MSVAIKKVIKGYLLLNYEISDPRTNPWPLMYTPWPILTILTGYLYFVFKIGPKLMEKRKAFQLDRLLVVYNALQILACCYIVYRNMVLTWGRYSFLCQPVDYSQDEREYEIAQLIYFYFMIKVIDLFDTVFFILRKKTNQVSFLHVYHHTGMVGLGWATTKFIAGGHSVYVSTLNSFVHIVMYSYYLLTSWDPEYKKSVWWKKHITQLQIVQFMMLIILYTQILFIPSCTYPFYITFVFVPQNFFMLVLFGDFYYKSYIKKQPAPVQQKLNSKPNPNDINDDNSNTEKCVKVKSS